MPHNSLERYHCCGETTKLCSTPSQQAGILIHHLLNNTQNCTIWISRGNSHLKILGAWRATWNKLNTKNPKILGATVQNLLPWVNPVPGICAVLTKPLQSQTSATYQLNSYLRTVILIIHCILQLYFAVILWF